MLKRLILGSAVACLAVSVVPAKATLIASDDFLTGGTAYATGNINTQTATVGTTGYFTGTNAGSQVQGWNSGTGAYLSQSGGLTNPLVVSAGSSTGSTGDGNFYAAGNANNRLQYRDLASTAPPVSSNYYFSTLVQEASTSAAGTAYVGLGPSRASGQNAVIPTTGYDVGIAAGALTLFYNNGGASLQAATLVASGSMTANATYMVEVHQSGTTSLTATVYNSSGTQVDQTTVTDAIITDSTDLGAFQGFVSSSINNENTPFTGNVINFDAFRFGTAESDVIGSASPVPEPATFSVAALGVMGLLVRRRRGAAE